MTAAQLAIQISMLVLEPLPIGEKRSRVPYAWSIDGYALNLASFQPMLDAPEPKTGPPALAVPVEGPLKEKELANRGITVRETTLWEMVMPFRWKTLHPELEHTE